MRWNDFRRAERMLRAGFSCAAVASRLGLHPSSVYRIRVRAKLPRRWYLISAAERRVIRKLLNTDLPRREVARRTGRGLGSVARIAASLGGQPIVRRTRRPIRCAGCGYLIACQPCLICAAGGAEDPLAKARRSA